ncbi:MAG TPA: oligosaccharide flippase family protein [Solirubrobacteraceae bacterium]|jgi:O-antigen/teichoic acid export membrane protein|nr:oligosaccharide flippase family protein [Solirubrobacteraceae bacterium]
MRSVRQRWRGRHPDWAWRTGGIPVNTAAMGARTALRALVQLALLPLLIDRLGAAPTGLFVFATTLTGYFTVAEAGLGTSLTKYVAEHRATGDAEQLGSVLRVSLLLMVGIGIASAAVIGLLGVIAGHALFGSAAIYSQVVPTLLVTAATTLFYWPSRLGVAALQGLERYDLTAGVQMVSSVLMLGLVYLASERTHSVAVLAGIFNAMLVFEGMGAAVLAVPHLGLRRGVGRWHGAHLRPALGFSVGLAVMGLADTFVYDSDRLVLAVFVGAAAITIYQVAVTIQSGVRQVSGLIGTALVSPSSRLVAQGRTERLRELVLVGSLYNVVFTVPLAVLILVLAEPIIEAWIGHGYGRYAIYAQIFVSYWLVHANTGAISAAITGIGRIRVFVWLTVVGALLTLGLSVGLVVAWGTVGVIWGTVIPAWLGLPLSMHFALRQVGISKARYARDVLAPGYLPIALWTVPTVGLAVALEPRGILELGVFCTVALAALWLALLPMLRARWRRALSDVEVAAAGAPA